MLKMAGRKTAQYKLQHRHVNEDVDVNGGSDEVGDLDVALWNIKEFATTSTLQVKQVERLTEIAGTSQSVLREAVSL